MTWVTREHPKIDRIACPWLIARFIDKDPAISLGLSRIFADDHEMLAHGMIVHDALYAWCDGGHDETHRWPPLTA